MRYLKNHAMAVAVVVIALFLAIAGIILSRPGFWKQYEHHPALSGMPKTAFSRNNLPADPINIVLVGDKPFVVHALLASGWVPADPITMKTSLEEAASALFGFNYIHAPVSNMYLWNRVQDLAFEQPLPGGARKRHHVRLWRVPGGSNSGLGVWLGTATFDTRVGLVHHSLIFTHRIAPAVDSEREKLVDDLIRAGRVQQQYQVTGVGQTLNGRTANGDWYYTDGEMAVCILEQSRNRRTTPPERLESPVHVRLKDRIWRLARPFINAMERFMKDAGS